MGVIFAICFILFVASIVLTAKPSLFPVFKRKHYGVLIWVFFILCCITAPNNKKDPEVAATPSKPVVAEKPAEKPVDPQEKAKQEAEAKAKAEADAKEKADAEATKKKADEEAAAKKKADDEAAAKAKEQTKQDYIAFYQKIEGMDKTYTNDYDKMIEAMKNNDANGAYDYAKQAKSAAKDLQFAYGSLKDPSGLTKDQQKALDDAEESLGLSYMIKAEALDSLMKYFDDFKPSELSDFKDKGSQASTYLMTGVAGLMDVGTQLGISTDQMSGK
jgi:hypothetical protein